MNMEAKSWPEERLAGQRLMAGFDGNRLDRQLRALIRDLRLGGLILFKRNLESPRQIAELCRSVQNHARDGGLPPLFIAIDQEGGSVARLGPPFTRFPGNPAIKDAADAERFARITAIELAWVGINMNLAPVLDAAPEGFDSIMGRRIFSSDPQRVAELGRVVIEGLQAAGVMAVAKHFPGIGRTRLDSHLDLPRLDADLGSLEAYDLIPFQTAIQYQVAGVMLSHILYSRLDAQWPASLSTAIARDLLRKRMGFDGVVLTDDLEMGAIARHFGFDAAVRQVLRAQVDVALICHSAERLRRAHAVMVKKIGASEKRRTEAEASTGRILALKSQYL
ncbi:MAG: beta-N-acetylhexosaminidase [Desulfobacterales bacterium]|jgi:beta-N-acetylhexosaminidase|nr:beta-N-acetylhexosaminidase [Desulfobacterales bacterium]